MHSEALLFSNAGYIEVALAFEAGFRGGCLGRYLGNERWSVRGWRIKEKEKEIKKDSSPFNRKGRACAW
jgi:hypothetical protein